MSLSKANAKTAERVSLQSKYAVQRSVSHSKVKDDGVQLYWKIKHTTENKDAPRITHIAWSNKNIAHWKMTWCFLMKSGCMGIPKLWRLYLLNVSWGVMGHPQAWAFVHSSSYCITLLSLHLKTCFIQNSNTILISSISILKIIDQLWFSLTCKGKHPR